MFLNAFYLRFYTRTEREKKCFLMFSTKRSSSSSSCSCSGSSGSRVAGRRETWVQRFAGRGASADKNNNNNNNNNKNSPSRYTPIQTRTRRK